MTVVIPVTDEMFDDQYDWWVDTFYDGRGVFDAADGVVARYTAEEVAAMQPEPEPPTPLLLESKAA